MTAKRVMDIEAVLRWTYRDELPKAAPVRAGLSRGMSAGWDSVETFVELLTVIDDNGFGVVPDLLSAGGPHDDALIVFERVRALDELVIDLPEDWNPMADLGDLGDLGQEAIARAIASVTVIDAQNRRRLRRTPRRLVEKHAILGGCPDWEMEAPAVEVVRRGKTGQPAWFMRDVIWEETVGGERVQRIVEVDGYSYTRRRPRPGAYQKTRLVPDPVAGLVERAEYEVWRAALDLLSEELSGLLESVDVRPSPRPMRPWEAGEAGPRILQSMLKPLQGKEVPPRRPRRAREGA